MQDIFYILLKMSYSIQKKIPTGPWKQGKGGWLKTEDIEEERACPCRIPESEANSKRTAVESPRGGDREKIVWNFQWVLIWPISKGCIVNLMLQNFREWSFQGDKSRIQQQFKPKRHVWIFPRIANQKNKIGRPVTHCKIETTFLFSLNIFCW